MACHSLLSMDSMYFSRPKEYIPERWVRGSPEFVLYKSMHPYAYMPFGYGVRACIGQRFAEMDLNMLILKVRKLLFFIISNTHLTGNFLIIVSSQKSPEIISQIPIDAVSSVVKNSKLQSHIFFYMCMCVTI